MKKKILSLTGITLGALLILMSLQLFTEKPNTNKNGFNRHITSNVLTIMKAFDCNTELRDICGATNTQIYFQTKNPNQIISTDYNLLNEQIINIPIKSAPQLYTSFFTAVDSPNIYIFARNYPAIFTYNQSTKEITDKSLKQTFSRATVISDHTFLLRVIDTAEKDQTFKKINLGDSITSHAETNITERRGDGGFSTDGFLYFDPTTKLLCYTFFYRNSFICFDTNLNLVYKAKTIDTTNIPQVSTKRFISIQETSYMLTAPPKFANLQGCVSNGKLFLRSALRGDNESGQIFEKNSAIDIYNLKNGTYKGSFYLPNYMGKRPSNFRVFENMLVALYDKHIVKYKMVL
jgi:hypothetical protein